METYKYLKENKIDVVHCHMTLMNIIPLIAAKKLKIKVRICHSHNSDVRRKNYFISFFEKICKKLNIRFATHLVACGEDAGRYLFDKENFLIINNAIDLNKFVYNEDKREKIDIVKLNAEIKEIVAREQILREEIEKIIAEIEV